MNRQNDFIAEDSVVSKQRAIRMKLIEASITAILDQFQNRVLGTIANRLRCTSAKNQIEDTYNETCLGFTKYVWDQYDRGTFDPETAILVFFSIARRRCVDAVRSTSKTQTNLDRSVKLQDVAMPESTCSSVELNELHEILDYVSARLPKKHRIVLEVYRQNLDSLNPYNLYNELARHVSKLTNTLESPEEIRNKLRYAIKRVRGRLTEVGWTEGDHPP